MFTGIIQNMGELAIVEETQSGVRWTLKVPAEVYENGESVSVNGCCLTVASVDGDSLSFDLSPETLRLTSAVDKKVGDKFNLERALKAGDKLGGHFVSGHVDGLGKLISREDQGDGSEFLFEAPEGMEKFIANKGSVALDGVSLTPFAVVGRQFKIALIPHTLKETTLGSFTPGQKVNFEIDVLARYIHRALETRS